MRFDWILPSFGLAVAVHAHFCGMHSYVNMAIVQMVLMSCLTLGVPEALRRASAKSTSQTKVAGLTLSALMFAAALGLVMLLLSVFEFSAYSRSYPMTVGSILVCIRCMQEYFYAMDDRVSALLTEILAGIAITAPPLMGFEGNTLLATLAVAFVLLVALVILLLSKRIGRADDRVRPEVALFSEVAASFPRAVMYPALIALVWISGAPENIIWAMAGLILLELSRTTFRRDANEHAPFMAGLTLLLTVAAGIAVVVYGFSVKMLLLAGASAVLLYGKMSVRSVIAVILLLAGGFVETGYAVQYIDMHLSEWCAFGCAAAALLVSLPDWLELARRWRVMRIRRKAMKARLRKG